MVSGECGELALTVSTIIISLHLYYMTTIQPTEEEMLHMAVRALGTLFLLLLYSLQNENNH